MIYGIFKYDTSKENPICTEKTVYSSKNPSLADFKKDTVLFHKVALNGTAIHELSLERR